MFDKFINTIMSDLIQLKEENGRNKITEWDLYYLIFNNTNNGFKNENWSTNWVRRNLCGFNDFSEINPFRTNSMINWSNYYLIPYTTYLDIFLDLHGYVRF